MGALAITISGQFAQYSVRHALEAEPDTGLEERRCAVRAPRPPGPRRGTAVLARIAPRPRVRRLLLGHARVGDRARRRPRRWRAARRTARSRSSARRAAPSRISAEYGVA